MAIRLFDIENSKVKASEHCYTIELFRQIMEEYPEDHNKIFTYYHYMCCLNDEDNPFANVPEGDKEDMVLKEIAADFSIDDELIFKGFELARKLYSTPTYQTYLDIKIMLERLGKFVRTTPITDGKDGNVLSMLRVAEKYDDVCKSFEARFKAFKEEQSTQARGGASLGYDQL